MKNNMFNKLDVISDENDESYTNTDPNWVFSTIKNEIREQLQLTTNTSVQIIKNEQEANNIT
jgi:hypothetical protein